MRTLLILLVVFLASCSTSSVGETGPVHLRVENASNVDLSYVKIAFTGDEVNMGTVESGQFSTYHLFDIAYHYGFVEVETGGEIYRIVPIDYVGEQPLNSGHYTYRLDIENGNLLFEFLEDDPESIEQ